MEQSDLESAEAPRVIDPKQAAFWDSIGGRHLAAGDVEPYGIEYVTTVERLREIGRLYPCPSVVDAGHGFFGAPVGLVFVDDENGRAMAYAPPVVIMRQSLKRASETIRRLREGLNLVDALASDQWTDAAATVERMQRAARETLEAVDLAARPPHTHNAGAG